jgi:hypothetical protein
MLKTFLLGIVLMLNSGILVCASDNAKQDRICRNYDLETLTCFTEVRYYQNKQKLEKARKSAQKFQEYLIKMRKACAESNENISWKIEEYNNHKHFIS